MDSENQCYICYDVESAENPYAISPCNCKGSIHLHKTCLETLWTRVQNCGICMESWNKPKKYRDGLELIEIFDDLFMIVQYTIDSSGNKHGLYQKWYKCGQIYIECTYDMDYRSGVYREWYSNGQIKTKSYYKNNSSDTENTPHWSYMKGLRHGISQTWYENGQPQEIGEYKHSGYDGEITMWYKNGVIQSKKTYQNTVCILSQTWYPSGQLCEYKDVVGEFRKYRKDGTLWFSGQYNKKGEMVGIWEKTFYQAKGTMDEYGVNGYCVTPSSESNDKFPHKVHTITHYSNGERMKDLVWINDELRMRYVKKEGDETTWKKETVTSEPVLEHIMTTKYKGTVITKKFQNGKLVEYYEK